MDIGEPIPQNIPWFKKIGGLFSRSKPTPKSMISIPFPSPEPTLKTVQISTQIPTPSIPTISSPTISREKRRSLQKAEYKKRKAVENELEKLTKTKTKGTSAVSDEPIATEEIKEEAHSATLTPDDFPWLEKDEEVSLSKMTLHDKSKKFYLGTLIKSKNGKLEEAEHMLSDHEKRLIDTLFHTILPDVIQKGSHRLVARLETGIAKKPLFRASKPGGSRVYFTRLDDIDGKPVILCVAKADKDSKSYDLVMKTITTSSHKQIKQRGRG
ncbi:MAG: hypothetical protein A3F31_02045 [Candidatus Levybacteria bacterium RIFCSPHIGHO2_12_FULL_38_12]|nr:MAG: hypothetical protein A2770_04000 [Candidatus Levybacteria bacterium RIFCSPHIGHO2_01_FULL_38_12]OGH22242.1 MAG: hypothetical protein A3F31_02045 [Candidatus Levybacteria bacterium RIFCSPHIGHO2_12_FULL_38_12]OGH43890.1 MAG: hypothetical protein A3J14_04725 [Candidatus Levybacteria bacterium RIFCSPLOWO2_02_FULL_37_18]